MIPCRHGLLLLHMASGADAACVARLLQLGQSCICASSICYALAPPSSQEASDGRLFGQAVPSSSGAGVVHSGSPRRVWSHDRTLSFAAATVTEASPTRHFPCPFWLHTGACTFELAWSARERIAAWLQTHNHSNTCATWDHDSFGEPPSLLEPVPPLPWTGGRQTFPPPQLPSCLGPRQYLFELDFALHDTASLTDSSPATCSIV